MGFVCSVRGAQCKCIRYFSPLQHSCGCVLSQAFENVVMLLEVIGEDADVAAER